MKSSTIAASFLAATGLAAAAPSPQWNKWGGHEKGMGVFHFTSMYHVVATPDQIINGTAKVPGQPGAVGYFNFGINSHLDTICYNITLVGVTGGYQSPAKTATHIHQGGMGQSGPPRLAFPNPMGDGNIRRSAGCLTGPFTTGVMANGQDTGTGFTVAQIEANPSMFYADVHTMQYVPGAVRGQL